MNQVKIRMCESVYSPAEDSYLLAEAVEEQAFGEVLDLGCGSGIQGITAALKGCKVTFADISEKALECARANAGLNNIKGEFIKSDLFSGINRRYNTIIFNPPYLYSKPIKKLKETGKLDANLDGGIKGRELIDKFINRYIDYVNEEHIVLMLESSLNGYENDVEKLGGTIIKEKNLFFEKLAVIKFG
ncbi:MAG: methyltransferase [Candidatus Marsarchaeota archaeon]|jgi:release factor glutamine methyltransferase|nr:methyltransferase [Candidatus Marsarchaeota archaeon]